MIKKEGEKKREPESEGVLERWTGKQFARKSWLSVGAAIVPAFDVRNAQKCPSRVITRAVARNEIYTTQFPEITFASGRPGLNFLFRRIKSDSLSARREVNFSQD